MYVITYTILCGEGISNPIFLSVSIKNKNKNKKKEPCIRERDKFGIS